MTVVLVVRGRWLVLVLVVLVILVLARGRLLHLVVLVVLVILVKVVRGTIKSIAADIEIKGTRIAAA